ncbi:MAG: hypothetical protein JNK82_08895 [Myxococcaceae bacterium]|nr:hypothetical protein [Myxococcaceae bacterium]
MEPELPEATIDDVDVNLLEYLQTLTPLQRVLLHEGARELALALQKAGRKLDDNVASTRPAEAAR